MMTTALFVCVHNAGRSQMAAAIFNRMAQERGLPMSASSAGTHPTDRVHPNVAVAMEEWGIDVTRVSPRLLTDESVSAARRVITMGCEVDADACPALFLKDVEDWGLDDPVGQDVEKTRIIRDEIERRVRGLIDDLLSER